MKKLNKTTIILSLFVIVAPYIFILGCSSKKSTITDAHVDTVSVIHHGLLAETIVDKIKHNPSDWTDNITAQIDDIYTYNHQIENKKCKIILNLEAIMYGISKYDFYSVGIVTETDNTLFDEFDSKFIYDAYTVFVKDQFKKEEARKRQNDLLEKAKNRIKQQDILKKLCNK